MISVIEQRITTLSPAEKRVAHWVLENPEACLHTPVAMLASRANVSEPTVVRFCRSVGCGGLKDFKLRMAQSLADTRSRYHSDVKSDDTFREIAMKVFAGSNRELNSALNQLSSEALRAAVDAMLNCRQIVFKGVGASGIVALDAHHKFFRLGIPCTAYTDLPTITQAAAIADNSYVIVAISKTGDSLALAAAAQTARDRGAAVITLTGVHSALAQAGSINLCLNSNEDTSLYTPMSSRLAQLCVLDALQICLATSLGTEATDKLKRTKAALNT